MLSHSQTARGPSSNVTPSQAPPIVIFELNQARRAKVTKELEAVRGGMLSICPQCPKLDFHELALPCSFSSSELPSEFLDWPTVEGFESFVEKRVEYGEMMEDHVADLQAVIREQFVLVEGLERAAKLAEERRLQEFQRALESMDSVEAEAARRAERERASRLQREYETRFAELDAEFALIRARVRAESPYNS
jgi:hypothetical protein